MDEMFDLILGSKDGSSSYSSWNEDDFDDFTGTKGKKLNDSLWESSSDVKEISDDEYYFYMNQRNSSSNSDQYTSWNEDDFE